MHNKIFSNGSREITVVDKISIFTKGTAQVYFLFDITGIAPIFSLQQTITNGQVLLTPNPVKRIRIDAGSEEVLYSVGAVGEIPEITEKQTSVQSTDSGSLGGAIRSSILAVNIISNTATITPRQHRDQILVQDASAGNVTMTTATGVDLANEFKDLENVGGETIMQYHVSDHAVNTSTLIPGVGVSLLGSGSVTETGGTYLLSKSGAATFDLLRVG